MSDVSEAAAIVVVAATAGMSSISWRAAARKPALNSRKAGRATMLIR